MELNGNLFRKLRNEMGLTQRECAEKLFTDQRTISRIEKGETSLTIWKFVAYAELLGIPSSDFWLLYLDTKEYEGYKLYKSVKRFLDQDRIEESREMLSKLENNPITEIPLIDLSIKYMRIVADNFSEVEYDDIVLDEILIKLNGLLINPIFDEASIPTSPLTHTVIKIINHIAVTIFFKKRDKAGNKHTKNTLR